MENRSKTENGSDFAAARPVDDEARVVGTWLARLGVLALLVGAGFGFKYAIDQGLIGPVARVWIGAITAAVLIAGGEASRRKDWPGLGQAVTAGGIGILYVTILSAYRLYGMVTPGMALALFTLTAIAGALLAIRHGSQTLAVLALLGGLMNPFLVSGFDRPVTVFVYTLILDVAALGLSTYRRWPALEWLANAGSWVVLVAGSLYAPIAVTRPFALGLVSLFTAWIVARRLISASPQPGDALVLSGAAVSFFTVSMTALEVHAEPWAGWFTIALSAAYLLIALAPRLSGRSDTDLTLTAGALAAVFATIAVPVGLHGPWVSTAWAAEGAVLIALGGTRRGVAIRGIGAGLLSLSVFVSLFGTFAGGVAYRPARILLSAEAFTFVVQIAALAFVGIVLARRGTVDLGHLASGAANVLALIFLSFELVAAVRAAMPPVAVMIDAFYVEHRLPRAATETIHFGLSAVWALYAGGLLAAGVAMRARWMRLVAVSILVITIVKVAFNDVMLLGSLYRTIAFLGLGVLLLLCSLMYHRFRDLIIGDES